jgi:hypothetical protein
MWPASVVLGCPIDVIDEGTEAKIIIGQKILKLADAVIWR